MGIRRPVLVGIVNITADSFSDGNRFLTPHAAVDHARRLRSAGADVIELGPAASHPGAQQVSAAKEIRQLTDVVESLADEGVPVSVDSYQPATQKFAAAHGAAYLNDIHALRAAPRPRHQGPHRPHRGVPRNRGVLHRSAGGSGGGRYRSRQADPRSGAGVLPGQRSRTVAENPGRPGAAQSPLRRTGGKSFLRTLTGSDVAAIGPATLAAELYAARSGADFIRTHDVGALRDALTVFEALEAAKERGW